MTLEQLVPTLAVCQQLKAAGFPQDTAMVWAEYGEGLAYTLLTVKAQP